VYGDSVRRAEDRQVAEKVAGRGVVIRDLWSCNAAAAATQHRDPPNGKPARGTTDERKHTQVNVRHAWHGLIACARTGY
jgi:hypothetical protein